MNHDVVVVGAGIAGLSVTATLVACGVDVVCLEATQRVGGRLLSVGPGEGALDLGASWFWPGEARVQDLVARLDVETFAQHAAGDVIVEDATGVRRISGNPLDAFAYRYRGGAQRMADGLAATLPDGTIHLARPVESIDLDADEVSVVGGGIALRTRHVILALPPALAMARIRFGPALPDRLAQLAAATPVWMGAVTKVVARYAEPFWREAGLAGAAVSRRGPLHEIHDHSGPAGDPAALFGFGSTAAIDPRMSQERAVDQVVAQLVRLFGPRAAQPERVLLRDWGAAPYTSPPKVEALANYGLFGHRLLANPVSGRRVHFASTETSTQSPGHVEGALAAAERAATNVLITLGAATPGGVR